MTVLDDDRLASLLATAGRAVQVPPSGPADILARAAGAASGEVSGGVEVDGDGDGGLEKDDDRTARTRRKGLVGAWAHAAGRHRVLTAAACIVVLLALTAGIGALASERGSPRLTAGLPHQSQSATPHGSPTRTTVPRHAPAAAGSKGTATAGSPDAAQRVGTAYGINGANAGPNVQAPSTTTTAPALPGDAVGRSAKIQQTGTLGLSVRRGDLGRAMTQLTGLAAAYDGFVASSQTQSGAGDGSTPSGTVTLQVPVDSFTTTLQAAQKVGRTTSLTTNATDVTGQYVDLQSRIAALQASRQQYLTILAKATTVGDVLAVQSQIDTIQTQIEQLQGQLQVLTSQTSYSKLTIDVGEGAPPAPPAPIPESGVVRAWHDSVAGFTDGVDGLIRIAGPLFFALLCAAVLLLGGRALWRRIQRHRL